MVARAGLLWLLGLALCVLCCGHSPGPQNVFPWRRQGVHERQDVQRELLEVLGLPERPPPRAPPAASASLFMLDLYHAMANGNNGGTPQSHLGRSDLVMSFVNMGECEDWPQSPRGERMAACLGMTLLVTYVGMLFSDRKTGCSRHNHDKVGTSGPRTGKSEGYFLFLGPSSIKASRSGNPVLSLDLGLEYNECPDQTTFSYQSQRDMGISQSSFPFPSAQFLPGGQLYLCLLPNPQLLVAKTSLGKADLEQEQKNKEDGTGVFLQLQNQHAGGQRWRGSAVAPGRGRWHLLKSRSQHLWVDISGHQGHSMDPVLAGLLGQQAPRSRQPFVVGFFKASPRPVQPPRAVRRLKKRQLSKTMQMQHSTEHPEILDDDHSARGRDVCRRHELYVSFRDLGWQDLVIAPQGYSAYYCAGECIYPLNFCMNTTNHATIQALIHIIKPDVIPKICCVPTQLSAISVLYYDRSNNVILRRERNMVVQACGCR
ncbi:bone morphogenetic protein 8B [Sigmodon hispidus]